LTVGDLAVGQLTDGKWGSCAVEFARHAFFTHGPKVGQLCAGIDLLRWAPNRAHNAFMALKRLVACATLGGAGLTHAICPLRPQLLRSQSYFLPTTTLCCASVGSCSHHTLCVRNAGHGVQAARRDARQLHRLPRPHQRAAGGARAQGEFVCVLRVCVCVCAPASASRWLAEPPNCSRTLQCVCACVCVCVCVCIVAMYPLVATRGREPNI
jgi:hypothetical protein